ncbi:putative retrotransposon hot spot (RHS) protein [Trypanosoma cruzi]|uniref:Retrotransposon hot spot (RHS) protein, putative n=1 Tax=Trypanosoma cruzi (strain CL Brener) TaxID=353153 RepID=Q4DM59_TRYCC|nr:retrotransposon hot spot (RHS) protein, putative [Trypanosoma cruzi]EAN93613.1 retrotransposon hot spot (RHS) protein, putative [Trypanosoma cruzi]RNC42274.1 putative retrotransposon hot spot (RHS) protein [Trypanosoma cruzi]|eukprot:XP_815464.1 retrotransposon hot spot (RHS) protein [Trypanosoma cruzi strain CL Brener]
MWRCCGRLHVALLRERWALTVSPTGVAVRLHGAPTAEPCECHAQRHWDCGTKQPRLPFGASDICWPQLGGASGMLHRTGVVMTPRSGIPGDGSDAAARHVAGSKQRPQWTMSSSVRDTLLEGSTLRTDTKLNDFLRSNLGGKGVVKKNENVAMEAFVQEPDAYVQDQRLPRIIFNLTEYQELEATYKLHHKGVFSLEQWRDYEGKDTVTPLARGKLNAALTQILTERLKGTQEMKFTISTKIEEVLFKGRVRVNEMKLNDFLTMELDGRGVVATNRDVLLKEFFKNPNKYIRDKRALKEIQISDAYARMERAVRDEVDLEEVARKLRDKGVYNLLGWSEAAAEVKATVHKLTKHSLDSALQEASKPTTTIEALKLEGLYESVYSARWYHVVEVSGGEGTGMKVKEGKPIHSWNYKKVGETFEKDDGVRKSGEEPPVLMVLTSDKGWPYTLNAPHGAGNDFFINCEVERVWQIVLDDLTEWFSPHGETDFKPEKRVLIGTPGIGKSMAAGSYLLYQLLHYDVEELQVVVHCFGETAYVFDKTTETVTRYEGNKKSKSVLYGLWQRGMKGYIIYDVAKKGTPPETGFLPPTGWGMIVVSSPNLDNYDEWEKQLKASRIIMNCPDEMDVKAMCKWMKRGLEPDEQAGYWRMVEERMENVGPIPRHIFDKKVYIVRLGAVNGALLAIKDTDVGKYFSMGGEEEWYSEDPSHKLVKIVREITVEGAEIFLNASICARIGFRTADRLAKEMATKDFLLLIFRSRGALVSHALEQFGLRIFMHGEFVIELAKELKELRSSKSKEAQDSVLKLNHQGYPTRTVGLEELQGGVTRIPMEYRVLYIPAVQNFPLVDGLFFVDSPRKTLVGLRMTTAGEHHTIPSTVSLFNERLAAYFNVWDELSRDMSWEMIYVQHENSTLITNWQRCGPVNTVNLSDDEKEIVAFWDRKVHEYQFALTTDFVNRIRAK